MLTCPNCHHVLAAHSCCGLNLTVPSAAFPPSATSGASVPSAAMLGPRLGPPGGRAALAQRQRPPAAAGARHAAHQRPHWPDSGGSLPGPAMAARMHTSGGGIRVLGATRRMLGESGWYWERLSWRQAETLLQSTSLGTFIVRDSADTRFLYSLSVQTERGPTSVRIHYASGKFRLDCESHMAATIPDFSNVIALVEHYIRVNQKLQKHFWVDAQGKVYCPITIRQPLKRAVPSLKHLCRLAINLAVPRSCSALRLPPSLCQYVDEYPYWC
ncbi:suppressor of cytokine signaling-2 like protein [Penaeus vannamei]|uniref:Suppressor of cytokine signaling-2 like protein n=1 Tax=Penaeus vannamei TaxID=6689 RepID=A0A423S9M4_PENVA|nr:suppressor of cytokine signaling-2 like protein [Penaeus vannamei]